MANFKVTLVLLTLCAASGLAVNKLCEANDTVGVEDAIVVDQTQFPVLEKPVQVNLVDEELNMMPIDEQFANAEDAVEPATEEFDGVEPTYEEIDAVEPAFEEFDAARPVAETDAEVETSDDKAIQKEEGMIPAANMATMFMPQQFSQFSQKQNYITGRTTSKITKGTSCTTPEKTTSKITPRTTTFWETPATTTLIINPKTTQTMAEVVPPTTTKFFPYGKTAQCGEDLFDIKNRFPCEEVVNEVAPFCDGEENIQFIGIEKFKFCLPSCKYSNYYGMWIGYLEPDIQYKYKCRNV